MKYSRVSESCDDPRLVSMEGAKEGRRKREERGREEGQRLERRQKLDAISGQGIQWLRDVLSVSILHNSSCFTVNILMFYAIHPSYWRESLSLLSSACCTNFFDHPGFHHIISISSLPYHKYQWWGTNNNQVLVPNGHPWQRFLRAILYKPQTKSSERNWNMVIILHTHRWYILHWSQWLPLDDFKVMHGAFTGLDH